MPLIISFTWWNYTSYSYPKGNFGGNQLLDGSMSLSPLYPCLTIDLHVRTVCELPPGFPLASFYTSIDHHLSGPEIYAPTQIFHRRSWSADGAPFLVPTCFTFITRLGFQHPNTRAHLRLLGPCFKTGGLQPFCLHRVATDPRGVN